MSWSASGRVENAEVIDLAFSPQVGNGAKESASQFDAAREAVAELIGAGVLGEGPYQVDLSGHANDGFGDVKGYATDLIVVNVFRVASPAES